MKAQTEVETGLLLMLVEEADEGGEVLSPVQAGQRFRPPLTTIRAEVSLERLYILGLVDWRLKDGRRAYFVTRQGTLTVESAFTRIDKGDDTSWLPKKGVVLDEDFQVVSKDQQSKSQNTPESAPSSPWVINNNLFQQMPQVTPASKSGTIASWTAVFVAVVGIAIAIWLAGKF